MAGAAVVSPQGHGRVPAPHVDTLELRAYPRGPDPRRLVEAPAPRHPHPAHGHGGGGGLAQGRAGCLRRSAPAFGGALAVSLAPLRAPLGFPPPHSLGTP